MMKRFVLLLFLMLLGVGAWAQETRLYITSDDSIAFEYPADWVVSESTDGIITLASREDLLTADEYVEGEVIVLFTYQASPVWDFLFEGYDFEQPTQAFADAFYGGFAVPETSEEVFLGGVAFYITPYGDYVDDPHYYITRTEELGLIFGAAYFDHNNEIHRAQVEDFWASLVRSGNDNSVDDTVVTQNDEDIALMLPAITRRLTPAPDTCEGMRLGAEASLPLRQVALLDVPEAIGAEEGAYRAYLTLPDGRERDIALLSYADTETTTINVPLLEGRFYEDTAVTLHIVDEGGEAVCPVQVFTVLALPPAPNAFADVVAGYGDWLAREREALGVSVDYLRPESTGTLTVEQYVLALAQYNYDDPNNPDSLVKLADGTASLYTMGDFDVALLDSLIGALGLEDYLTQQETIASWRGRDEVLVASLGMPDEMMVRPMNLGRQVEINDFETLVYYMDIQASSESFIGADTERAEIFNNAALLNSLAGAVTGPVGVTVGAVMYTGKLLADASIHMLPSKITVFDLDYVDYISYEDSDITYNYSNLRVTAESKRWSLKYTLLDGVLTLSGMGGALSGQVQTAAEVGSNLASRVDGNTSVVDGVLVVEPFTWADIPVLPEEVDSVAVISRPSATPAVQITNEQTGEYKAWNAGESLLRFILTAGNKAIVLHKPVTVETIEIAWDHAGSITLLEGETYCFDTQINYASDVAGRFVITGPQVNEVIETDNVAPTVCFDAPAQIERVWSSSTLDCDAESVLQPEIYSIEFESMTRDGARDPDYNPSWVKRNAFSIIRVEPRPENHLDAVAPINEACTVFEGDWEFTLQADMSFLCTGSELQNVVTSVNLTGLGDSNLRRSDVILVTGFDNVGLVSMAREEEGVFVAEASYEEDGVSVLAEITLYLQGARRATVITRGYSNLYDMLEPEAQAFVPLCESIAFFLVYDGVYVGD